MFATLFLPLLPSALPQTFKNCGKIYLTQSRAVLIVFRCRTRWSAAVVTTVYPKSLFQLPKPKLSALTRHPQNLATAALLSVFINVTSLGPSQEWNLRVCHFMAGLFHLANLQGFFYVAVYVRVFFIFKANISLCIDMTFC